MEAADFALRYASFGWNVIPVEGKRPVGMEWEKRATNNQAAVARLFSTSTHDGVGVQLGERSGLIDFDCDSDEAEETLMKLFNGKIPRTPSFRSTRGRHVLFRWTNRLPQGSIKFVIDGLEIRLGNGNKGCQTVFPPSGGRTWLLDPDEVPVVDIPGEIVDRINNRFREINQPKKLAPQPYVAYPSSSDRLDVPKWLQKHGREIIGRTDGSDGVTRWHIECPGVDSHTTPNSWRDCCVTQSSTGVLGGSCFHSSCGMRDWNTLRDTIGPLEWSDYNEDETGPPPDLSRLLKNATPPPKRFDRMPNDIYSVGGIIGRLLEHNARTSLGPMPELALAGAIALLSVITGHKVRDFRNLRTNSYVISLAPSGAGKDDARKVNKNILRRLNHPHLLAPTKIKSSAGMISALVKQNPSLFQLDELSGVLRTMRDPERNPHMADVITVLLEAWSEATGYYEPGAYADAKKNPVINQPHLCIYGTAVANEFWGSLTKRNLTDGLVGRLLVFEHVGYPKDSDGSDVEDFDETLLSEVRAWLEFTPPGGGNLNAPTPIVVEHSDAAIERYLSHRKAINAREGETEVKAALWRRCNEKAGKLALIAACSRCAPFPGREVRIELEDVNWGIRLANWLTNNMLSRSQFKTADSPHEQNLNRILDLIQDWTRKEIIGQRIRTIRADEREKIIRHAISDGLIEVREVETNGRKATEYRVGEGIRP